jgi:hypothetical protein
MPNGEGEDFLGERDKYAFAIGDILDKLERAAREVGRSLDHKNRLDLERLRRVRESVFATVGAIDTLITAGSGDQE